MNRKEMLDMMATLDSLGNTPRMEGRTIGAENMIYSEHVDGFDEVHNQDTGFECNIEEVLIAVKNKKTGEVKNVNTVDYCFLGDDWASVDGE